MADVTGTDGNDFLDGTGGADNISGLAGSDTILGGSGNDVLTGGPGADFFFGFIGDQNGDTITDFQIGNEQSGADRISIQLGNAAATSVNFQTAGNDLIVTIQEGALQASLTLTGLGNITPGAIIQDNPGIQSADIFITNDGTGDTGGGDTGGGDDGGQTGSGGSNDLPPTVSGTPGPDLLFGTDGADVIAGFAGNDTIVPGPGLDVIQTGDGADAIFGQAGSLNGDIVADFTTGAFGSPTADFLNVSLAAPADVSASAAVNGNDLVVTLNTNGTIDAVTLEGLGVRGATVNFDERPASQVGTPDGTAIFVTINTANNQAPVAADDLFTVQAGTPLTANLITGDNGNGADTDDGDTGGVGNPLQIVSINQAGTATAITGDGQVVELANGTLTIDPDGDISYELDDAPTGTDTITYTVTDGLATDTATVTFGQVNNVAPVAANDTFTANTGQTLTRTAANGVLSNDTDDDGDTLTVTAVNGAAANVGSALALTDGAGNATGQVTLAADGSFSFVPQPGATAASFTYTASDGTDTSVATVTINVGTGGGGGGGGGGDTTVAATNDSFIAEEDVTLSVDAGAGLLANDTGAGISVVSVNGTAVPAGSTGQLVALTGGVLSIASNGSFVFENAVGNEDPISFDYAVSDGTDTSVATVTIDFGLQFDEIGTNEADRFDRVSSTQNNAIDGAGGNDVIITGDGNDTVSGGDGDDFIDDNDNQDTGENILQGGNGNDQIIGRAGSYEIDAGAGNDNIIVYAALGTNTVEGGDGDDIIEFRRGSNNTIDGGAGNDQILIQRTIFNEIGLRNTVLGGEGNDTIEVRDGYLNTIDGGTGDDVLIGGSGSDTFRFSAGFGQDTVRNFGVQGFDQIDLSAFAGLTFADFVAQTTEVGPGNFVWSPSDAADTLTIEGFPFAELNEVFFIFDGA